TRVGVTGTLLCLNFQVNLIGTLVVPAQRSLRRRCASLFFTENKKPEHTRPGLVLTISILEGNDLAQALLLFLLAGGVFGLLFVGLLLRSGVLCGRVGSGAGSVRTARRGGRTRVRSS